MNTGWIKEYWQQTQKNYLYTQAQWCLQERFLDGLLCFTRQTQLVSKRHIRWTRTIPVKFLRFNSVRVNKASSLPMSFILLILLAILSLPMMHTHFGPKPPKILQEKTTRCRDFIEASSSDKNKMLFLPKQMRNSTRWQRRKGIRQTAWQSKVIWIHSASRDL